MINRWWRFRQFLCFFWKIWTLHKKRILLQKKYQLIVIWVFPNWTKALLSESHVILQRAKICLLTWQKWEEEKPWFHLCWPYSIISIKVHFSYHTFDWIQLKSTFGQKSVFELHNKGQLISKANFKLFIWTKKNNENIFLILP